MGWDSPIDPVWDGTYADMDEVIEVLESLSVKLSGGLTSEDFENAGGAEDLVFSQDIDLASGRVINVGNIPVNWYDCSAFGLSHGDGGASFDAIKAAIAAAAENSEDGGIVWIPPGEWALYPVEPIAIPQGVIVTGAGVGVTSLMIWMHTASEWPVISVDGSSTSSGAFGPTLKDLTIGYKELTGPHCRGHVGIGVSGYNCRLENVTTLGFVKGGFNVTAARSAVFTNCNAVCYDGDFENYQEDISPHLHGWKITGGLDNSFVKCGSYNADRAALVEGELMSKFFGCEWSGVGVLGSDGLGQVFLPMVRFRDCANVRVHGCSCINNRHGFMMEGCVSPSVVGLTCRDILEWDAKFLGTIRGRISGCSFMDVDHHLADHPDLDYYCLEIVGTHGNNAKLAPIVSGCRSAGTCRWKGSQLPQNPGVTGDLNFFADETEIT